MSDDRIVDYLRLRGQTTPPLDLVGSVIDAIADAPQQRHTWFAAFLPAAGAATVVTAVVGLALVLGQRPAGGDPPFRSFGPEGTWAAVCEIPNGAAIAYDGEATLPQLGLEGGGRYDEEVGRIVVTADPIPVPPGQGNYPGAPAQARYACAIFDRIRTALFFAIPDDWQPPETERSATPVLRPSVEVTAPPQDSNLLERGDVMQIEARSVDGVTGRISIDRGEDIGGYPLVAEPSSESHFFIELHAVYELDRTVDESQWGEVDWHVETVDGTAVGENLTAFPHPDGRPPLGTWPGATVPEPKYEGWLIFAVPREAADVDLVLVYQPPGIGEPLRIPVRSAGNPPPPVAAAWPRPDPVYVAKEGLPLTVLASDEADALFIDPDTCTNPEAGYTVTYPDSWYTNTEIGGVPACSWFSPVLYDAVEGGPRPAEIAIEIRVFDGNVGFIWVDLYSENIALDGIAGRRYETGMTKDVATPTDSFQYAYLAALDARDDGTKLWAFTGTEYGGAYELNRAVLDRIMASIDFGD